MNKKSVIICICVALVLLLSVGAAIGMLYSDRDAGNVPAEPQQLPEVLRAIPPDAAVVMCFQNAKHGVSLLSDSSQLLHVLVSTDRGFLSMLRYMDDSLSVKSQSMAVSLHHAGVLDPLMVLEIGGASDTTEYQRRLLGAAEPRQLACSLVKVGGRRLMLVSSSESLVESSVRHIERGASVVDDEFFASTASTLPSKDAVFFSNNYAGKLISTFCTRELFPHSTFVKNYSEWMAFGIAEASKKHLLMSGNATFLRNASYSANILDALKPGDSRFAEVAPSSCLFAVDLAVSDFDAYRSAYERYLDASMSLQKHRKALDTLAAHTGVDPLKWMRELDVREVAKVVWPSDDALLEATLLRLPRQRKADSDIQEFAFGEFAGEIFGPVFGCKEPICCCRRGEWMCIGSEPSLKELSACTPLQDALSSISQSHVLPQKDMRAVVWFSAGEAPEMLGKWFKRQVADEIRETLDGAACEPVVLCIGAEGLTLESVRPEASFSSRKEKGSISVAAGVEVSVPGGPFEVTNCATGKTNLFYQNSNLFLCLKDAESGKGLWGVPFDKPICGSVACVDYFDNGKLQFLFASGSSLYLIDRLGRFVKGFPVDLGKEVLIGPDAYTVSGVKTVVVLHKDNTVGMYDINGGVLPSWKGIAPKNTILSLPEYITIDGRGYWSVETSGGCLIYESTGGDPLKGKALKNLNL